jgi:hypothetical protein
MPNLAGWKAIITPAAFLARLRITLTVHRGKGVEAVPVRGDVDEAHGVVRPKNFNWLSVLGALN